MKQVWITGAGGPEKLQVREAPDPSPRTDELRVRVAASGINFADILARQGLYPDAPKTPCVVGYEFSGTVDAVGPDVDPAWIGKPIFGSSNFGGYSDLICVPPERVFEKPDALTHPQAAALPVNYLTAWQLLVGMGSLAADETLLIHNAGGGVGLAAIDIARHIGATIYGTASRGKHAFLKQRGLHEALDYADWPSTVEQLTGGQGVELIVDPIGGSHWKKSYKALRAGGRLGMFGISEATESRLPGVLRLIGVGLSLPWFNPVSLMNQNRGVFGVSRGRMARQTARTRAWMQQILDGAGAGWVRPHVDKTFSFEQAGEAHAYIEARRNTGKVVLVP